VREIVRFADSLEGCNYGGREGSIPRGNKHHPKKLPARRERGKRKTLFIKKKGIKKKK